MNPDERAELKERVRILEDRLSQLQMLARHQSGLNVTLYNGLLELSTLMLTLHRSMMAMTLPRNTLRPPEDVDIQAESQKELDAFGDRLKDIFDRLGAMDEYFT
jgi:hypothetical protein